MPGRDGETREMCEVAERDEEMTGMWETEQRHQEAMEMRQV